MIPISDHVKAALKEGDRWGVEQHGDELAPFAQMVADLKPRNVLEIGFRRGGTLAIWHELCAGFAIGVDLRDDFSVKRQADLEVAYPRLRCVLADSHVEATLAAVKFLLNEEPLDLLFIDGDHSAAGVRQDWENYRGLVRPDGIVAFHDIQPNEATLGVHELWKQVGRNGRAFEFNIDGPWGGIGVVRV